LLNDGFIAFQVISQELEAFWQICCFSLIVKELFYFLASISMICILLIVSPGFSSCTLSCPFVGLGNTETFYANYNH